MSSTVKIGNFDVPKNSAEAAICYLAGRCNWARTLDGMGFARYDVEFGHSLAGSVEKYGRFTPCQHEIVVANQANGAKKNGLIIKYRKQLTAAGFDIDAILDSTPTPAQQPEKAEEAKPDVTITFEQGDVQRSTDKAILLRVQSRDVWLPRSQIKAEKMGAGIWSLTMPAWLAADKHIAAVAA